MADLEYHVLLRVATRGLSHADVIDKVGRARLQAGARQPILGITGVSASSSVDPSSDDPEPTTQASFPVVAPDEVEVARVLDTMVDWLENHEHVVVLGSPRIPRIREVEPMCVGGRGLRYDAETGLLTITPEAGPVELQLVGPHETEPGTLVLVTTEGQGWPDRETQSALVQRITIEPTAESTLHD